MLCSYTPRLGGNGRIACPSEFSAVCACTGLVEYCSYTVRAVHSGAAVEHPEISI